MAVVYFLLVAWPGFRTYSSTADNPGQPGRSNGAVMSKDAPESSVAAVLADQLVLANRILAQKGVLDGYGHVSVRHPDNPGQFLLSRSKAPATITASDIMIFDGQGEVLGDDNRKAYLERYIHAEIYAARPDVQAVVHSHSLSLIPFGVTSKPLRPVYNMGAFLSPEVPIFEIRERFGDGTNLLIVNNDLGAALADSLGQQNMVLMRGHGNAVVGEDLKITVFRAVYAEMNARVQMQALQLGDGLVTYLTEEEAEAVNLIAPTVIDRTWQLWVSELIPD